MATGSDDRATGKGNGNQYGGNTPAQVNLILSELVGSAAWPPDWERQPAGVDYLYRAGSILVRDEDLERVRGVVDGEVQAALTNGVTRFGPKLSTAEALQIIDDALGLGVATPDHVLYVTTLTFCPATEPKVPPPPVPPQPDPPVATDSCDGTGVSVSVVDTGWLPDVEPLHSWLTGVQGDAELPLDAAGNLRSYAGHGTFAAGVVRAAAPKCEVFVDGILPAAGAGFESDMVTQLFEALKRTPDLISLQAGTTTRHDLDLLGFDVLFTNARRTKGTVLLAAAGNDGGRRPFWPAAFEWAVAVGGLTEDGTARASWSNFGPWVDVYARGENHVNAFPHGKFVTVEDPVGEERDFEGMASWSGTSFSTPYVAGVLAAYMSARGLPARHAWHELYEHAKQHALPGVGPVVTREMACQPRKEHHCGEGDDD